MPFKKVGTDDYTSPSGRHFNGAQVRLYHANGDKFPGQKSGERAVNKGYSSRVESFAQGGEVLGRTRDFIKEPDRFRDSQFKKKTEDVFGKGESEGPNPAPAARGKSLPAVKPRS